MNNNSVITAWLGLTASLKSAYYQDGRTPKARTNGNHKSGMTRKGAVHKHNPTFKPGVPLNGTPAQYRREHRGVQKKAKKGE